MNPANPLQLTEPANQPALWNPNVAANWSLIFSPAFGAFIHARNAEVLGRPDEVAANQKWLYGSLLYLALTLLSVFVPSIPDSPFRLISLVILLTWYFSLAKKQVRFVKEIYGTAYQKKSWGTPLLIASGCLVWFLILVFALSF